MQDPLGVFGDIFVGPGKRTEDGTMWLYLTGHRLPCAVLYDLALDPWWPCLHRARRPQLPDSLRGAVAHSSGVLRHPD